jgi:hypothetical protein
MINFIPLSVKILKAQDALLQYLKLKKQPIS